MIKVTFILLLILSIILPFGTFLLLKKKEESTFKATLGYNVFFFFGIIVIANIVLYGGKVSAKEIGNITSSNTEGFRYIAAALSTGMSTIGAGIAVASAASAALGALSEDSNIMGKALIFVALAEGVALYGMLISFMILG